MNRFSARIVPLRAGLTIVEFLVIAAIISLLMALLIPAIQKVREVANRTICASNLRQLGIAAHHYHTDRGKFPPGYLGPSRANETKLPDLAYEGQWIGHLPTLLPYFEQESLARRIDVSFDIDHVDPRKWFWAAPASGPGQPHVANYRVAMTLIKQFRCPSSPPFAPPVGNPAPTGGGSIVGLHVFNSPELGPHTVFWRDEYGPANPYRPLARTNYVGVAGCGSGTHPFFSKFMGIYANRSDLTLGHVTALDGASNTLLYGETCGSGLGRSVGIMDISWMAGGSLGTYRGLERAMRARISTFSSCHSGGVQFCFADGAVRLIRFGAGQWNGDPSNPSGPDWLLLQQLAGWRDGGSGDTSRLID
jgi:prepilin-type processing-associated H-X9-DG protein